MRTREESMPVLAIVGAGPGMGLAIAETFGANGYKVGLLSRDPAKLHTRRDEIEKVFTPSGGEAGR
jgi:short-subunit dehydrogenase